ncbi:putative Pre (Mob) type recombination enzyme [Sulfitobacter noctilucicola]|nr:putative Pre (Mob) type recombination enzyme [Sulfitobacter noctilucicola]
MHDHRNGGDLSHVDLDASELNEVLHCEPKWQDTIKTEVAAAKRNNFRERMEALRKKGRKAEREALIAEGESDPWRRCSGGPLREGILTVNKEWFGGTGQAEWDAEKVAAFKKAAMDFLLKHFPAGQLRYANAHHDEEAFHIHFVAVVWTEKVTANRGLQVLLQASLNPLLKNYERAQDLAGEAFAPLGIARGERRAEARRVAKETGKDVPEKRRHIPPSEWRADQQAAGHEKSSEILDAAQSKAKEMVDEGRTVGKATIRKSRKRAVKEARRRKEAATREVAAAERRRKEEERAADSARKERADAEATLGIIEEKAANIVQTAQAAAGEIQQVKEEMGVEVEKLQGVRAETEKAKTGLADVLVEVECAALERDQVKDEVAEQGHKLDLLRSAAKKESEELALASRKIRSLRSARQAEALALDTEKRKRAVAEAELADVEAKVVTAEAKLSKAVSLIKTLVEGIDMLGGAVLRWISGPKPSEEKLGWGPNAPKTKEDRRRIAARIQPVMPKLIPLAQSISRTIEETLSLERAKIAADAAYVLEQREKMEAEQRAELTRILNANSETDPTSDGPGT